MLFVSIGGLLIFIGTVWLIVIAIQTGQTTGEKALWAVVNFFCQPLSGIIFYVVKRKGLIPLILIIIGWLIFGPGYYTMVNEMMRNMPR